MFVRNIHEEAQEDDVNEVFGAYGNIKNIHINLDRRTGFIKVRLYTHALLIQPLISVRAMV